MDKIDPFNSNTFQEMLSIKIGKKLKIHQGTKLFN